MSITEDAKQMTFWATDAPEIDRPAEPKPYDPALDLIERDVDPEVGLLDLSDDLPDDFMTSNQQCDASGQPRI